MSRSPRVALGCASLTLGYAVKRLRRIPCISYAVLRRLPTTTDHPDCMTEFAIIGSVLIGAALGVTAYAGSPYFRRAFEYVETDFYDKLKRLRMTGRNLRPLLICWLGAVMGVSIVMWIGVARCVDCPAHPGWRSAAPR